MSVSFPFHREKSSLFGTIFRPVATAYFWSETRKKWINIEMVVDTGSDYTLFPRYICAYLDINLKKDCVIHETSGIGGSAKVYILPKLKARIGKWEREIPVGFINRNDVPPLMGRHLFLETFDVLFSKKHTVRFEGDS